MDKNKGVIYKNDVNFSKLTIYNQNLINLNPEKKF